MHENPTPPPPPPPPPQPPPTPAHLLLTCLFPSRYSCPLLATLIARAPPPREARAPVLATQASGGPLRRARTTARRLGDARNPDPDTTGATAAATAPQARQPVDGLALCVALSVADRRRADRARRRGGGDAVDSAHLPESDRQRLCRGRRSGEHRALFHGVDRGGASARACPGGAPLFLVVGGRGPRSRRSGRKHVG